MPGWAARPPFWRARRPALNGPRLTGQWRTAGRRPGSDPVAVTAPGRAGAGGADGTARWPKTQSRSRSVKENGVAQRAERRLGAAGAPGLITWVTARRLPAMSALPLVPSGRRLSWDTREQAPVCLLLPGFLEKEVAVAPAVFLA